jgi:hypothetical protein
MTKKELRKEANAFCRELTAKTNADLLSWESSIYGYYIRDITDLLLDNNWHLSYKGAPLPINYFWNLQLSRAIPRRIAREKAQWDVNYKERELENAKEVLAKCMKGQ